MSQISQTNVVGGVNLDKDRRYLKPDELSYAQDAEFLSSTESGQDASAQPMPGSVLAVSIPDLTQQFQYVRLKYDHSSTSYLYYFSDSDGNPIGAQPITAVVGANLAAHIALINAALGATAYTVTLGSQDGLWYSLKLSFSGAPVVFSVIQIENTGVLTNIIVYTLQEAFDPANSTDAQFKPVADFQIGNNWFIFSKSYGGTANQIGYAVKDQNGVFAYTTLVITSAFNFPLNQVVEVQGELNNNQYCFYWCDNTNKDKALYAPAALGAYSILKYDLNNVATATSALFTLESIETQTNLQIQNYAFASYADQLQSGGTLASGTWFYTVRVGFNKNYSEWSALSGPFTTFKVGTNSPGAGAYIGGDRSGTTTSKANVIAVTNAKAAVYNTIQLAAVVNQGGAFSAIIVGEYAITDNDFEITHTGFETGSQELDINTIPNVQDVILKSKNLQVKKNINNVANSEIAVDEAITAFDNAVLGQGVIELDNSGRIFYSDDPIFRASRTSSFFTTTVVQGAAVPMQDATTAPNFNPSGDFNLATNHYTVGATGDYTLSYIFDFGFGTTNPNLINIRCYIKNITQNVSYASATFNSASGSVSPSVTETLTLGDVLQFTYDQSFAGGLTIADTAMFSVVKTVGDYTQKLLAVGEYQRPDYIAEHIGYMVNETYQYFYRVLYNNGFITQWRYIGDYVFNGGANYASQINGALQKLAGTTVGNKALARSLTISGIDISTLKDDAYAIEIGFAITTPTVLGTGIAIASHGNIGGVNGGQYKAGLYTGQTTANSYGNDIATNSDLRYFANMISTDWIMGEPPQFATGDFIVNYGCGAPFENNTPIVGAGSKYGSFREFTGYSLPTTGVPQIITIKDAYYTQWNTPGQVLKQDTVSRYLGASLDNTGTIDTMSTPCMTMALADKIAPIAGTNAGFDFGCYYVQYMRPSAAVFDPKSATVVSTGHIVRFGPTDSDMLPMQTVFGGDIYTQKTYIKVLYNALNPDTTKAGTLTSFIGYYSQNRINSQMRYADKAFTNLPYPFGTPLADYIFGIYTAMEQFNIDAGYTWRVPLMDEKGYDSSLLKQTNFENRIWYSLEKPAGSLLDLYRTILPNNYKDLAANDGPILGLYDTNDIMLCLQPRAVSVLPYQSDVALSKEDGSIYIGNGGVYAQRENKISAFGPSQKTGTLKGENRNGLGQVYWLGDYNRQLLRYGYDGAKSLSDENHWRVFFLTNTRFITHEFDVVMGFDRNRKSVFVTARARNTEIPLWHQGNFYEIDDKVHYGEPGKYQGFEQLQDIYIAKTLNTGRNPYDNPDDWELVPHTDNNYYNEFTVVWNEKLDLFQGQITPLPERYLNFTGKPMAGRGISPYNSAYDLFSSTILQWFEDSGDFKPGTFILEWSVNNGGKVPISPFGFAIVVDEQDFSNYDNANNPTVAISNLFQTAALAPTDLQFVNGQIGAGATADANGEYVISNYYLVRISTQNAIRILELENVFRIVKPVSLK